MPQKLIFTKIYKPSEDVVAREIHKELIIVPIAAGIGDDADALFSLNVTGRMIWDKLDGKKNLKQIIKELVSEFNAPVKEVEEDVVSFTASLLKKRILSEVRLQ